MHQALCNVSLGFTHEALHCVLFDIVHQEVRTG